ncbi:hypothetical protein, partial [Bilophila wadsworthia]|uniref:hypothetical protein n=1 Tax=Bilophila wadsworthia TaxID=35833 RepID=UPI003AB24DCE
LTPARCWKVKRRCHRKRSIELKPDGVFLADYRYTVPLVLNGSELTLGTGSLEKRMFLRKASPSPEPLSSFKANPL